MRIAVLLVLVTSALAQTPPPTCDAFGLMLDSVTGQPIARVQVGLSSDRKTGTVSDGQGRWRISNIPCRPVGLLATRRGYEARFLQAATNSDTVVRLAPVAQVSGKVLDENGEPFESASVVVYSLIAVNGRWTARQSSGVPTDPIGQWSTTLPSGRYVFCASGSGTSYPPGGGEALLYAGKCLPGPAFGPAPLRMKLEAGQRVSVDFTLRPSRGVHVRGTVTGAPRGGWAVVHIGVPDHRGAISNPKVTAIAEEGVFDLSGISPGHYLLEASAVDGDEAFSALTELEVGQGDLGGIYLSLSPRATLTGTLEFALPRPQDVPDTFRPEVLLDPVSPGATTGPSVWDDERRAFTISHIVPGTYRVVTRTGSYGVQSMLLDGRQITEELTIRQSSGPLEIRLSSDTGSLDGTVRDKDGMPRSAVILFTDGKSVRRMERTGSDGRFAVPKISVGRYRAWVVEDPQTAAWAEPEWQGEHAGSGAEVNVTVGTTTKLDLVWAEAPPV